MSIITGCEVNNGNKCSTNINGVTINNDNSTKIVCNLQKEPRRPYDKEDFNVPVLEESLFVGRENILEQLSSLFFNQNIRKVALCGLPGYGKTETAKRFIKDWKSDKLNHILWMNASTKADLERSFDNIADKLNFEKHYEIREVFESFNAEKTIIVFDNAPNRQIILEYETAATNFFCLITSYNCYWEDDIKQLEINELSIECALEILNSKLKSYHSYVCENSSSLNELAVILGKVPLPLQIIGSYIQYKVKIRNGRFDLKNYVKKLKFSQEEIINNSVNDDIGRYSRIPYSKSLYGAMKICFDEISKDELASNLLYVCSYLNPEHIFYNTLYEINNISKLLGTNQEKEETLSNAAEKLKVLSLVQVDFKTMKISIHSFVQMIIRYHVSKCDKKLQIKIYGDCLRLTLSNDHYYHIPSIIKRADTSDDYTNTFFNFYLENFKTYETNGKYAKLKSWEAKCTGLQLILEILIEGRCKKSLENTLDHLKPNTEDYINKFNLLNVAAMSDDAEIFQLLLKHEPCVNQIDIDGHCALHAATFKWNEEIINLLLEKNANKSLKDNNNNTFLHTFIRGSYYIPENHIDTEQAKRILERIKDSEEIKEITNGSGKSLLHEAAAAFQPKLVHLLMNHFKIDANIQDPFGNTPLHILIDKASKGQVNEQRIVDTAQILLDNNALVNIPTCDGKTPLEYVTDIQLNCLKELFDKFKDEENVNM